MSKETLLKYVSDNYNSIIKEAIGGPYIEIDLIPDGHDGVHEFNELIDSCNKLNIDTSMLTRSYYPKIGDGIRMGRYFYFMQQTTKEILEDLHANYPLPK